MIGPLISVPHGSSDFNSEDLPFVPRLLGPAALPGGLRERSPARAHRPGLAGGGGVAELDGAAGEKWKELWWTWQLVPETHMLFNHFGSKTFWDIWIDLGCEKKIVRKHRQNLAILPSGRCIQVLSWWLPSWPPRALWSQQHQSGSFRLPRSLLFASFEFWNFRELVHLFFFFFSRRQHEWIPLGYLGMSSVWSSLRAKPQAYAARVQEQLKEAELNLEPEHQIMPPNVWNTL